MPQGKSMTDLQSYNKQKNLKVLIPKELILNVNTYKLKL